MGIKVAAATYPRLLNHLLHIIFILFIKVSSKSQNYQRNYVIRVCRSSTYYIDGNFLFVDMRRIVHDTGIVDDQIQSPLRSSSGIERREQLLVVRYVHSVELCFASPIF